MKSLELWLFTLSVSVLLCAGQSNAQDYIDRTFEDAAGNRMDYRLWLPPGHDQAGRTFPLVTWLGWGLDTAPQGLIDATQTDRFPAFVLTADNIGNQNYATCHNQNPSKLTVDCPPGTTPSLQAVLSILEELQAEFPIDATRRSVSGYSFGSVGSFEALVKHPGVFSAAIPIQGGYDPELIVERIDARVWSMHGHDDGGLPPYWSNSSVKRIMDFGVPAIHLEPPGGHDAVYMDRFFQDPDGELYSWLFDEIDPPLAALLYDPTSGSVTIDATSAPGGEISRLYMTTRVDLGELAISEVDGEPIDVRSRRIRFSSSDNPLRGMIDFGPILSPGLDLTGLHEVFDQFYYNSSESNVRNRPLRLLVVPLGDTNTNGVLDVGDINQLVEAITGGINPSDFDFTQDGSVDVTDLSYWVRSLKNSWFGDANLDAEFTSGDLVQVFQVGHYEDGIAMNSGWAEGDWNGDGEFDTSDLVLAFQDGGYEQGPRSVVAPVPEPSTSLLMLASIPLLLGRRNSKTRCSLVS